MSKWELANTVTYEGQLYEGGYREAEDVLYLSTSDTPLMEELQKFCGMRVSVRYWWSANKDDKVVMQEKFLRHIYGVAEGESLVHYSETTGFLWMDEELKVGGHSLPDRLRCLVGYWLILEVTMEKGSGK